MRNVAFSTVMVALAVTMPAAAQLEGIYIPPQCEIDTKHFLAKQAESYVKAASEAREPEERERALQDAYRSLNDAVARGEEGNGAIWYFFGRTYVLDDDYRGADSALARASALLPECGDDIDSQRYNMWVPVYNEAVLALQASDYTTALPSLVNAQAIYKDEPNVPFYLAQIYASNGEHDSGLVYFRETLDILERLQDTAYTDMVGIAVFNTARLFHQKANSEMDSVAQIAAYDSAATWYVTYLESNPDDVSAMQAVAAVYHLAGRTDEALGAYESIIERGDQVPAQDLFSTGVLLFQDGAYELAARAFEAGLAHNPYFRDGVYNLGQSYYALASPTDTEAEAASPEQVNQRLAWTEQMLGAAVRLAEIDPLNVASGTMLAQAYQLMGEEDSTATVIERLNALDFEVVITSFTSRDDGFDIGGQIVNVREEEIQFPGLTFNWIDASGATVTSDTVPARTVAPQGSFDFSFTPVGEGLVAWLYERAGG